MEKPKLQTITFYYYYDCRRYIESKLGKDLNLLAPDNAYESFDEYVDSCDSNFFELYKEQDKDGGFEYINKVIQMFYDEFGENATYAKD
jgi:hypothetical protein